MSEGNNKNNEEIMLLKDFLEEDRDEFLTDIQLAYKLLQPDNSVKRKYPLELPDDLRKAYLDTEDKKEIEQLLQRAMNIQLLLRNIYKKWVMNNIDKEAEVLAEEWARKDVEAIVKELQEQQSEIDAQTYEELINYYKKLYLPKAKLKIAQQVADGDFYPSYHYKLLVQKLMLSGSKKGWFLRLFRTKYRGRIENEEERKRGFFR